MDSEYREQARAHAAVAQAVAAGTLPTVSTLACFDCRTVAAAYHHYLGYAPEHRMDVVPLCNRCHVRRHLPDRKPRRPRTADEPRKTVTTQLPVPLHQGLRAIAVEQHRSLAGLLVVAAAYYAEHWPAERERDDLEARPYYADLLDDEEADDGS